MTLNKTNSTGQDIRRNSWAFYIRALSIFRQNPRILQASLRHELLRKVVVPVVRRWQLRRCSLPATLSLNITRRCNLSCHMCIQHRHNKGNNSNLPWYDGKQELPLSDWINVLDQAVRFRPVISVIGGEPTLYSHFRELLQALGDRKMCFELTTNGLTLAGLAEELVAQDPFIVNISIDGPEEVHDKVRGASGSFRKSVKGIKALVAERHRQQKANPFIILNCTISKVNLDSVDQMIELALDLGVDRIQFLHVVFDAKANVEQHNALCTPQWAEKHGFKLIAPSMPEGEYYENLLTVEDLSQLQKKLESIRKQARGRIPVGFQPDLGSDEIYPYYQDLDYPYPAVCNSLWASQRIMPDGSFSPCLHVVVGNIKEQSLKQMWNSPQMWGFRETVSRNLLPACVRCCSRTY